MSVVEYLGHMLEIIVTMYVLMSYTERYSKNIGVPVFFHVSNPRHEYFALLFTCVAIFSIFDHPLVFHLSSSHKWATVTTQNKSTASLLSFFNKNARLGIRNDNIELLSSS